MYVTFVRPHLEFSTPVFSSLTAKLSESIESIQSFATKIIINRSSSIPIILKHSNLTYQKRSDILNLESIEYRRNLADLITFHAILTGHLKSNIPIKFRHTITRGSQQKLVIFFPHLISA